MARVAPVSVWLLLASVAFAQEGAPPPAEKTAPPSEDAIAAAQRDFNAIRGARGSLEQSGKLDLSSLSAPQLQMESGLPRPQSSSKIDPKTAKKSANWLVDAMMKSDPKESRDPRERVSDPTRRERDAAANSDLGFGATQESQPTLETDARGTAAKDEKTLSMEKRVGPEFNPLANYMAGWMTPQDYSLLKPGLDGAAAASLGSRGDPSLPAVGADLSVLGDAGSALDLAKDPKPSRFELPKPADNPFLQSLTMGGVSAAPAFSAAPSASSVPASSLLAPVPVELAPAKSKIPDFAKPATNEKYFKQLKRF